MYKNSYKLDLCYKIILFSVYEYLVLQEEYSPHIRWQHILTLKITAQLNIQTTIICSGWFISFKIHKPR